VRDMRKPPHVHPARAGTHQWKQLKKKFRSVCRASNALCHLCVARGDLENAVIDYDAPPLSPRAFEPDHIHSPLTHPWLRYEWSNLAASHSRCNRQRRDEPLAQQQQQQWVKPDW
jgi:hypothetical protein